MSKLLLRQCRMALQEGIAWHESALEFADDWDLEQGDVENLKQLISEHQALVNALGEVIDKKK